MGTKNVDEGQKILNSDVFSKDIMDTFNETTTINPFNNVTPTSTERSSTEKLLETNVYYYDDNEYDQDYLGVIEESIDRISEEKHVIIFVKTQQENSVLTPNDLQYGLVGVVDYDMTIFINDEPAVVQQTINSYDNVIFVDANIDSERRISGNVFSDSKPLEDLEGEDYEEALSVLNQVSSILEGSIASHSVTTTTQSAIVDIVNVPRKIIIMITSPVSIIKEDVETVLRNELLDADTEVVVHVNSPQEVLQLEYQTKAVPILVTPVIDRDLKSVSGNIYYNSEPLENIRDQEKYDEAFQILSSVIKLLEANVKNGASNEDNLPYEEISQNQIIEETKKILIAINTQETILNRINKNRLTFEVSNQENAETVVLFNPSKDVIQQQLDGYAVPILINLEVDKSLQMYETILYRYQPIENLNADDYDKAIRLLTMVKSSVQTDLQILVQEEAEDQSFDSYGERENIVASEFILADYEVEDLDEGSGSQEISGTDNPSKNLDFGFIQEITSF